MGNIVDYTFTSLHIQLDDGYKCRITEKKNENGSNSIAHQSNTENECVFKDKQMSIEKEEGTSLKIELS